jgi:hypothetical protein
VPDEDVARIQGALVMKSMHSTVKTNPHPLRPPQASSTTAWAPAPPPIAPSPPTHDLWFGERRGRFDYKT